METKKCFTFGEYYVDIADARLTKSGQNVNLPPKAFAMLVYLLEHRGTLITKDELLDAVWGHRFITEGVLKSTAQMLRQALADDARAPKYLETVHRRGYRFIAAAEPQSLRCESQPGSHGKSAPVVGRGEELGLLRQYLNEAAHGKPQLVFVSGQAGIGKTTLIERFLADNTGQAVVGRGQCIEQYGQGEPYLPILEILNSLCKQLGAEAQAVLAQTAPDWLAELPWLASELGQRFSLSANNSRTRMLRELGELLGRWSASAVLVLVLEDLHWSDRSTLDALAYLSMRSHAARWLVVASYRPEQPADGDQALAQLTRDLLVAGLAREIALPLLPETAIAEYLRQRHAQEPATEALAARIFQRCEGLPFYMAQLADDVVGNSGTELPAGLQHLLGQQFERLPVEQQALLRTAAVAGMQFGTAMLADLTGDEETIVEAHCESLAQANRFLDRVAHVPGQYAFRHAYYHEYIYSRLPSIAKAAWHRKMAVWLEGHAPDSPAALARHFELGGLFDKAVDYWERAVSNARQLQAHDEAIMLARKALALLDRTFDADNDEMKRRKIRLYNQLGMAMRSLQGYGIAEQAEVYALALELARELDDAEILAPLLKASAYFHMVRLELVEAEHYAGQLLTLATAQSIKHFQLSANVLLAGIHFCRGDAAYPSYAGQAAALYEPSMDTVLLGYSAQHPMGSFGYLQNWRHWLEGRPHCALTGMQQTLSAIEKIGHPISTAFAHVCMAVILQLRGDWDDSRLSIAQAAALSEEYDLEAIRHWCRVLDNWLQVETGEAQAAVMGQTVNAYLASGTKGVFVYRSMLAGYADICIRRNDTPSARKALQQALDMQACTGVRFLEAELLRLQGELLLLGQSNKPDAALLFRQALACAERQGFKSLALRAAISLMRMDADTQQLLQHIYSSFEEGFDTQDLRLAAVLLQANSSTLPLS